MTDGCCWNLLPAVTAEDPDDTYLTDAGEQSEKSLFFSAEEPVDCSPRYWS